MKKSILFSLLLFVTIIAKAQHPEPKSVEKQTPKQSADLYTNSLKEALDLNETQTKKVNKIYLKKTKKQETAMSEQQAAQRPSGSFQGAGYPNDAGMPPGGGQRPQMNPQGKALQPQFKGQMPNFVYYEEPQADIEKRENQMKKILDQTQYKRWQEIEKETFRKERERMNNEERKHHDEQLRMRLPSERQD